jgi:hypothetical protein
VTIQGLSWSTIGIPLGVGLNQKGNAQAGNPPALDVCIDAQFDDLGGLRTRYPFVAMPNQEVIVSLLPQANFSNMRKIVANGDELLCFTKTHLFTWNEDLGAWATKAEHLAVKVDEEPRFIRTAEQTLCDRAEVSGFVVYAWQEGPSVWWATVDKATGSVLTPPREDGFAQRPRLVALDDRILFFVEDTFNNALGCRVILPDDPNSPLGGSGVIAGVGQFNGYYDATRILGANAAAVVTRITGDNYIVARVDASATVTASTKARSCTGPIAISSSPDGFLQIARDAAGNVEGDLVNATTLADVFTGQFLGAGGFVYQIAAAHESVVSFTGFYRCMVFWQTDQSTHPATGAGVFTTWVDTNNNVVAPTTFKLALGIASRAFDHEGSVYINLVFAGESQFSGSAGFTGFYAQLQNTYFLFRSDGFLVAKSLWQRAGGFQTVLGFLPGVALVDLNTYAWCGTERRVIPLGEGGTGYADRGPRDVFYTFDSDEARRCVRVGTTLLVACGEGLLQYDGERLTEVGFHYYPYFLTLSTIGAPGNVEDGEYAYKATYRSNNARGDLDRSTTATVETVTVASGPQRVEVAFISTLHVTHKQSVVIEFWRTAKTPTDEAPFYLASSNNPADTALVSNAYVLNADTSAHLLFKDELADSALTIRETNPENGSILEGITPPPASIVAATDTRVFLAGIAGDPDRVWYSKLRNEGETVAFHEALTISVPPGGGRITSIVPFNDALAVFRETAIYMFGGDGFANDGSGTNYGPARTISTDVGAVNHEGVGAISQGLIFKASGAKGWHVLDRGWNVQYAGAPIADYDDERPLALHVLTDRHQVRILTANRLLVWDTVANQWGEWTIDDGIDAAIWQGVYHYLTTTGPSAEQDSYSSGVDYGMDIETAWIKLTEHLQGIGRVRRVLLLGEYRSPHAVRVRVARDYKATASEVWDYYDDQYWPATPTVIGEPEQLRIGPSQQQCQAIKIRFTIRADALDNPPTGESVRLSGLSLEVGQKRGPYPMLPSTQKR